MELRNQPSGSRAALSAGTSVTATMPDRVSVLKQFEILKSLSESALRDLAESCSWQSAPSGKLIVLAKEPTTEVYFVAAGKVSIRLYSAMEGRQVLFTVLGPHEMFGEMAAIDGSPRSATVEAEEDCVLAILTQEQFKRLVANHPAFALAVMRQLTAQVRRLSDRVYEFSTLAVQSRVHAELLRLAAPVEERNGQALLSRAPVRAEFAARISTTREAISRVITRLEEVGIARREGTDLRILDMEGLRKLVRDAKGE
jgi:CRP/FNR family transcriptional regulator, cyclic AMP receptor protein